jgi:hypothetical protein
VPLILSKVKTRQAELSHTMVQTISMATNYLTSSYNRPARLIINSQIINQNSN